MSNPEIIKLWKEKAEIDYIPPFMSLWVSLDAWMKNRFNLSKDRNELEELKRGGSSLFNKFSELIDGDNINGILFRSYFAELHRALLNAHIPYNIRPDKIISFKCCMLEYKGRNSRFESILVEDSGNNSSFETSAEFDEIDQKTIALDDHLMVESDSERLFVAYIEIVYQVRCALFHGDLAPTSEENKRVIQQLYLTLSMIMENI